MANPAVATPANIPSADTPTQTAAGRNTVNGSAFRAAVGAPSARSTCGTATAATDPTSTTSTPAQAPPPRPIRSSIRNARVAAGGWLDTCVVQLPGRKSMMWEVNPRRKSPTEPILGRSCRYSLGSVSRSTHPRRQPSTNASDVVQATAVSQPTTISTGQRMTIASRRAATAATTASTRAAGVPGPTWGSHFPISGGAPRNSRAPDRSIGRIAAAAATNTKAPATHHQSAVRTRRRGRRGGGSTSVGTGFILDTIDIRQETDHTDERSGRRRRGCPADRTISAGRAVWSAECLCRYRFGSDPDSACPPGGRLLQSRAAVMTFLMVAKAPMTRFGRLVAPLAPRPGR